MKHLLKSTALALSLALSGPALALDDHTADIAAETTEVRPALWKVADEDTTIYLFGTVHLLPESVNWEGGVIGDAIASSDELVTELGELDETRMAAVMGQRGVFTDGTTLRSLLDEEQLARYEAMVTGLGAPVAAFDQLEPWMTALTLSMLPLMQQGWTPEQGVEKKIDAIFDGREIDAVGLETIEQQADFFDTLPQDVQVAYLMSVIDDFDKIPAMMDTMLTEWKEGDPEGLAALVAQSMGDPVIYKALLVDRNERWSVWIDDRLDEPGTVFMAVGAGHLTGNGSVQEFLTQRGLEVTRIQ